MRKRTAPARKTVTIISRGFSIPQDLFDSPAENELVQY